MNRQFPWLLAAGVLVTTYPLMAQDPLAIDQKGLSPGAARPAIAAAVADVTVCIGNAHLTLAAS